MFNINIQDLLPQAAAVMPCCCLLLIESDPIQLFGTTKHRPRRARSASGDT